VSAKARVSGVAAAAAAMLLLSLLLQGVAAALPSPPPAPNPPREGTGAQLTSFYFGKNFQITPVPPFNQTTGQMADANGVTFPRALLTNVGTWTVTLREEGMTVDSLDGLSIWASSDQNAQNVRFTINVEVNGNPAGQLNTETKGVLSTPTEFRIDPGSSNLGAVDFPKGSQISFNLQYRATSSPLPVGPSASSVFLYYSDVYRSRVDFVTNPFNLTLAEIKVESRTLNVTEIVKDAFGVDAAEKRFFVSFSGPTSSQDHHVRQVDTRVDPINGTTLIWNWDFASQGSVSSGAYAVTLSAQYLGAEANYSNVTSAELDFPPVAEGGGGFLPGIGLIGLIAVGGGVAVAAVAVPRVIAMRRRG